MIDDYGNKWSCITVFGTWPYHHVKIGEGWKRMVLARRLQVGAMVRIRFPHAGKNDTVYIEVKRPNVVLSLLLLLFCLVVFNFLFILAE
jgi:hypothetical protein